MCRASGWIGRVGEVHVVSDYCVVHRTWNILVRKSDSLKKIQPSSKHG